MVKVVRMIHVLSCWDTKWSHLVFIAKKGNSFKSGNWNQVWNVPEAIRGKLNQRLFMGCHSRNWMSHTLWNTLDSLWSAKDCSACCCWHIVLLRNSKYFFRMRAFALPVSSASVRLGAIHAFVFCAISNNFQEGRVNTPWSVLHSRWHMFVAEMTKEFGLYHIMTKMTNSLSNSSSRCTHHQYSLTIHSLARASWCLFPSAASQNLSQS